MSNATELKAQHILIRTPDQRLRVFVSSTLRELEPERQSVRQAISRLHLAPVMFESGARPHPAQELYQAYLSQSHIFIGVYWQSYGWVGPGMQISGLEDEYNRSAGLPRLIYIKKPSSTQEDGLKRMLERIMYDNTSSYKYFETTDELESLVENDLILLLTEYFETARSSEPHTGQHAPIVLTTVPIPRNRLIGRESELQLATNMLLQEDVAMLTFSGSAGAGKSRLGIQLALNLSSHFVDGVFMVCLESIQDPQLVIPTIAKTLEVKEAVEGLSLMETLKTHLCSRQILILLDNFEHVITAASQIAELLEACPYAKVVVTSRSPLRVRAERVLDVPPLAHPPHKRHLELHTIIQYPAVQLFTERAQSVRMDFQVTEENAQAVAEITHRLDGLPLAIELAAAWIKILTPQALLWRMKNRFEVLRGGTRDLPERQHTMYKAIDWSYNLLEEKDKRLLQYLSVFVGGWTFDSAEAVCTKSHLASDGIYDGLERLINNNLIKPPEEVGAEVRMKQFESVRDFAYEHLLESDDAEIIHEQYTQYFLSFAEQAEAELLMSSQQAWHRRVNAELDNLRAVMRWSIDTHHNDVALRITNALWRFWWSHGFWSENLQWLITGLNSADAITPVLRARALTTAGWLNRHMGNFNQAINMLEESLAIWRQANDIAGQAITLTSLGASRLGQGNIELAQTLLSEAQALAEQQANPLIKYVTLENLGHLASRQGNGKQAQAFYYEALNLAEQAKDDGQVARLLNAMGDEYVLEGSYDEAEECFTRAAMLCNHLGNRIVGAYISGNRGVMALKRGDYANAQSHLQEAIREVHEHGDKVKAILCLGHFAMLARMQENTERSIQLLGAGESLRSATGLTLSQPMHAVVEQCKVELKEQLGDAAYAVAWQRGIRMSYEQAIAFVLQ